MVDAIFEYTPLSTKEIDALHRMVDGQELYVEIVGWGFHPNPKMIAGDKRIQIHFPLEFTYPEIAQHLPYVDLVLKLRDGTELVRERLPVQQQTGEKVYVHAGIVMDMIWDMSIDRIDSTLVRRLTPGIRGKKIA